MDINKFKNSPAGKILKTNRDYWAFIPNPLSPKIKYTKELVNLLSEANRHLGNLNGVGTLLPNPNLLVIPYVRREAVLSSRIEGTQTSLSELFYFEAKRREEQKREAKKTDVLEGKDRGQTLILKFRRRILKLAKNKDIIKACVTELLNRLNKCPKMFAHIARNLFMTTTHLDVFIVERA